MTRSTVGCRTWSGLTVLAGVLLIGGCSGAGNTTAPVPATRTTAPASSAAAAPMSVPGPASQPTPSSSTGLPVRFDQKLHDELVDMMDQDQAEMTGGSAGSSYRERTDRIEEILVEHGWPTYDLVGEDGEDAAWLIVQHADLDPDLQERGLELLAAAVDRGQASPGNLAYLYDRVAVGRGEPQRYGTQIRCGVEGPVPATPIEDEAGVEARRAASDLDPLSDYLAELAELCSSDETG